MGKSPSQTADYSRRAKAMRAAIESYFGATVCGYETYRYYDGNDILRSWICMPLIVGIYDRAEGTIDALFHSDLYTSDGLLTAQGSAPRRLCCGLSRLHDRAAVVLLEPPSVG